MIKSYFIFFIIVIYSVPATSSDFMKDILVKSTETNSYTEIEVSVPVSLNEDKYNGFVLGLYDENKELIFYTELKANISDDFVHHEFRISRDFIQRTNVSVIYGDGILCESNTMNFRLKELLTFSK
jgi:hypothetical protein